MKYLLKIKRRNIQFFLLTLPLTCLIALNSCKQNANSSESELINKVNAVHKQMMVQGNISEQERQAILSLASLVANDEDFTDEREVKNVIQFDVVENVPVYPGCEGLSQEESKQCFIESINHLVETQFNADIAKNLGISEPQKVEVIFKIGKNGKMSNLKVRDANVTIQAEAARVIKQLPVMKPATQNGEVVEVMCSTIIPFGG